MEARPNMAGRSEPRAEIENPGWCQQALPDMHSPKGGEHDAAEGLAFARRVPGCGS